MDDEVLERHLRSLNVACGKLGISMETLLKSTAGRWYVLHVEQELLSAPSPGDLSMAISNTIELAAGLPADQRQGVQGIGIAQSLALSEVE